jgi:hypothetical protein
VRGRILTAALTVFALEEQEFAKQEVALGRGCGRHQVFKSRRVSGLPGGLELPALLLETSQAGRWKVGKVR